jgi:hypothetical protein
MSGREVLEGSEGATLAGVDQSEGILLPFGANCEQLTGGVKFEVGYGRGKVHHGLYKLKLLPGILACPVDIDYA